MNVRRRSALGARQAMRHGLLGLRGRTIFGARDAKGTRFPVHGGSLGTVRAVDVPEHPRIGVPGRVGRGSRAVPHLPGARARHSGVVADPPRVRGRGSDRLGRRPRSRARPPRGRQPHRRDPAPPRPRLAHDLLRVRRRRAEDRRRAPPGHPPRAGTRGRDRRARAAAPLLRRDPRETEPQLGGRGGADRPVYRLPGGAVPQPAPRRRKPHPDAGGLPLGLPPAGLAPASRHRRAVRGRRLPALRHGAPLPRVDARRRRTPRGEPVRAGPVGGAVPVRVPREDLGVLLGAARDPRAHGPDEHGVEQHQSVDGARRDDPAGLRLSRWSTATRAWSTTGSGGTSTSTTPSGSRSSSPCSRPASA